LNEYVGDIVKKIQEKGRKVKVTSKLKYLNNAFAEQAASRVSSLYVIVLQVGPMEDSKRNFSLSNDDSENSGLDEIGASLS
jgi:hypothetical protein